LRPAGREDPEAAASAAEDLVEQRLIILDGYNLVHRSPALRPGPGRSLAESRQKLLNLLAWAYGGGDARFLVVFDGAELPGGDEREGRVEVRYSRPPEKADDLIRRLVEDQVERVDRLTVVSSDLEVLRHARAMGADVSLADMFLASAMGPRAASEDPEKPATLSKKEVEEWAERFREGRTGDEEDDAPER
jgi:predicted RNA-binding protein with PIN domain